MGAIISTGRCKKKTLALKNKAHHSGKHSKQRLTLLLCFKIDGTDKRDPVVIKKSVMLRCIKGKKELLIKYVSNSKAWMGRRKLVLPTG